MGDPFPGVWETEPSSSVLIPAQYMSGLKNHAGDFWRRRQVEKKKKEGVKGGRKKEGLKEKAH